MKIMTFTEFANKFPKLDSIHGNCGLDGYSLIVDKTAVADPDLQARTNQMSNFTGEKLYMIDKGRTAIMQLFDEFSGIDIKIPKEYSILDHLDKNGNCIRTKVEKIQFEEGVNIYKETYQIYNFESTGYYINVRRVVLPLVKDIKMNKAPRIYVIADKKGKLHKFPSLIYPSSMKDFLKWLKTTKLIKFSVDTIWDKDTKIDYIIDNVIDKPHLITVDNLCNGYVVMNLKTDKDIENYNDFLKSEKYEIFTSVVQEAYNKLKAGLERSYGQPIYNDMYTFNFNYNDLPLNEIVLEQSDIDNYINSMNNRFKIER